jgi:superfamily II DNA or RNA helicase
VIVDESHTCALPEGGSRAQHQRHDLLQRLASKEDRHLVLLTATPHSGKPAEFQSLLGLIKPEFETVDVVSAGETQRKHLAAHFVQRRRADVERWLDERTIFPKREAGELDYDLTPDYRLFFDDILSFAQKLVQGDTGDDRTKRVHYWTALALLRGVMSSPAAGVGMLRQRLSKLGEIMPDDVLLDEDPVHDQPEGYETDVEPGQLFAEVPWSDYQKKKLKEFEERLAKLAGMKQDNKLLAAELIVRDWLAHDFQPVIFCRYIATAKYLGEQLTPLLRKDYPKLEIQVVTSEDPDELRRNRIEAMKPADKRLLIATDCLSEGINLHEYFTAVLHYDLPWNPNRLEQREGRVDRFGQTTEVVKAFLLFSKDNPVDGVVLDVILRKVREIKRATGINIPFPEDSKGIIDTIAQSLLLNPDRKVHARRHDNQIEFSFQEFDEARKIDIEVSDKFRRAEEREKISRSIFAQHSIKAQEIEQDLRETDEAIGDPKAVEAFVVDSLRTIFGVQIDRIQDEYRIRTVNLPDAARGLLPEKSELLVSFNLPTPKGHLYLGRNHPFVEQLCQSVLADTIQRRSWRAARAAVFRTTAVEKPTTVLLLRCRNVIERRDTGHQLVAEEMLLWGWRGEASAKDFLDFSKARNLLFEARPSGDFSAERQARLLQEASDALTSLREEMDSVAEVRCQQLVAAHERFSKLIDKRRYQIVYPVLPMDVLGIYLLLPDA